jgi:hypothetical protein
MVAMSTKGTSRKQMFIVIGLGVALLAIVAFQAPKFLGGGGSEAAPSTTTDAVPTSSPTTGAPPATGGGAPTTVSFGKGTVLAGVKIAPGLGPKPLPGQLASFTLFAQHDPFVQLVKDADGAASGDGETTGVKVSSGGGAGSKGDGGTTGSSSGNSSTPGSSQLTTATISVNGTDESVQVKGKFPASDPTFVLLSLKPKVAQIGVVGGSVTGSGTIALKMGQPLTLVNTATGARYTLKLLYTGSQPEQVQGFTKAEN